jgi:hypothetical protein
VTLFWRRRPLPTVDVDLPFGRTVLFSALRMVQQQVVPGREPSAPLVPPPPPHFGPRNQRAMSFELDTRTPTPFPHLMALTARLDGGPVTPLHRHHSFSVGGDVENEMVQFAVRASLEPAALGPPLSSPPSPLLSAPRPQSQLHLPAVMPAATSPKSQQQQQADSSSAPLMELDLSHPQPQPQPAVSLALASSLQLPGVVSNETKVGDELV